MQFLYKKNLENNSGISSLDLQPGSDLDDLFDTRLSRYTSFLSGDTSVTIIIEFPEGLSVDAVGIGGHSFGEGSTLTVNGGDPVEMMIRHALVSIPLISADTFTLVINDPTMSPGDPRYIGRLELGEVYNPPDISSNLSIDQVSNSTSILSSSRQVYGYRKTQYGRITAQMPLIEGLDAKALRDFYTYVDVFVPFFVSFNEECFTIMDNYVILEDTQTLTYQMTEGHFYTSKLSLSEVF